MSPSRPSADGDERLGQGGVPADRVAAQSFSSFNTATVVTVARDTQIPEPIGSSSPGRVPVPPPTVTCRSAPVSLPEAVVVIDQRGSGTYADNVEFVVGDASRLTVVWVADWADDTVQVCAQHARLGKDAVLRHVAVTLGGDVVRMAATVRFDAPGGDAELLGLYFADDGQHFESRLLVDHAQPNCKSNVLYKGALQGDPDSKKPDAHTVWVGDVLIRAEATGTDTFEVNRNLVLTDGARADSVPNLEIETGEIVGLGMPVPPADSTTSNCSICGPAASRRNWPAAWWCAASLARSSPRSPCPASVTASPMPSNTNWPLPNREFSDHSGNQGPARQRRGRGRQREGDPQGREPRREVGETHAVMGPNGSGKSTLSRDRRASEVPGDVRVDHARRRGRAGDECG